MRRIAVALLVFACCEPSAAQPSATVAPQPAAAPATARAADPASRFADLETRLLGASSVRVTFAITATGSNTANLRGVLELSSDGKTRIDARGSFAGETGELHFESNGRTMKGECQGRRFELASGTALHESLLLGLTRMGLLHNLAVLWSGRPPDRADGGVREWVVAVDHDDASTEAASAVRFGVSIDGTVVGEATLVLDDAGPDAGWPTERTQTVHFPTGDMQVVERYEVFEVITEAAPATTARPP